MTDLRAVHSPELHEPADFAGAFLVEHADIPVGLTIADYRRSRGMRQRGVRNRLIAGVPGGGRIRKRERGRDD